MHVKSKFCCLVPLFRQNSIFSNKVFCVFINFRAQNFIDKKENCSDVLKMESSSIPNYEFFLFVVLIFCILIFRFLLIENRKKYQIKIQNDIDINNKIDEAVLNLSDAFMEVSNHNTEGDKQEIT